MYKPLVIGYPGRPKLLNEEPEENQPGILICPDATILDISIAVAAVYIEYGLMLAGKGSFFGSVDWQGAKPQTPVNMSIPFKVVDAVRVWRFSPIGEEPQVTIQAR